MMVIRMLIGAAAAISATAGTAQTAPASTATQKSGQRDPATVKCKTHTETGNLAHVIKECHTLAEWASLSDRGQSDADYYRQVMNSGRTN